MTMETMRGDVIGGDGIDAAAGPYGIRPGLIKARPLEPEPLQPDRRHKFLTTRRYPIYCLTIAKCGCTFLKNLFYLLDHDCLHRDAENIHNYPQDLRRAHDVPSWMIRSAKKCFVVLRDPVARNVSLYFDKVWGEGKDNFGPLRDDIAAQAGLSLDRDLDAKGHRRNLFALADWLEANIAEETDIPMNPHWRPQTRRDGSVAHYAPTRVTLEGIDWQLPMMLDNMIDDIAVTMRSVRTRNATRYPVPRGELVDADLDARIRQIYAEDHEIHAEAAREWKRRRKKRYNKPRPAPAPAPSGRAVMALTTRRRMLSAVVQPGAGDRHVQHLAYILDHGHLHPHPDEMIEDDCLWFAQRRKEDTKGRISIAVIRDPVMRFFDSYLARVSDGTATDAPVLPRSGQPGEDAPAEAELHLRRTRVLLAKIAEGRAAGLVPEADLRPQSPRIALALRTGFTPVTLDRLGPALRILAQGKIRDLDRALRILPAPPSPVARLPRAVLADPFVRDRIAMLYASDTELYERVRAYWTERESVKRGDIQVAWQDGEMDVISTAG